MRNKKKTEKIFVYGSLGVVSFAALLFILTLFLPVDVLKNWHITTEKQEYQIGSSVKTISTFEKVMSVNGKSKRYVECKINNTWSRFPVQESSADRPLGKSSSESFTPIPDSLPNQDMTCRIYFQVEYLVYKYRPFIEEGYSNEFQLTKKEGLTKEKSQDIAAPVAQQDSDSRILCSVLPDATPVAPPPVANTPNAPPQSQPPVKEEQRPPENSKPPVPEPPPPSILQQILESLFNFIRMR